MNRPATSLLLFQRALHAWVLLYVLTALPVADLLWFDPITPLLPNKGGIQALVDPFAAGLPRGAAPTVLILTALAALFGTFRQATWWSSLVLWLGFNALMHLAFLASSGGLQLASNLLFWNIPLALGTAGPRRFLGAQLLGGWAIRLQLLVAYATTALHKLEGLHWTGGTALRIVATDEAFGPVWLASMPQLATFSTWAILAFQLTFPLAVWWRRTRVPWMLVGLLFHGATAFWMGVPEMAAIFLVAYLPWMGERTSSAIATRLGLSGSASGTAPQQ